MGGWILAIVLMPVWLFCYYIAHMSVDASVFTTIIVTPLLTGLAISRYRQGKAELAARDARKRH